MDQERAIMPLHRSRYEENDRLDVLHLLDYMMAQGADAGERRRPPCLPLLSAAHVMLCKSGQFLIPQTQATIDFTLHLYDTEYGKVCTRDLSPGDRHFPYRHATSPS